MAPFDTFTLFSSLPKELRLQIWEASLNPTVIVLHRSRDRTRYYFPFSAVAFKSPSFMSLSTDDRSLDVIPRVCAESLLFCQKRYMELEVWDLRRNRLGTYYDPHRDVIFFSHHISPALLQDFADQYPVETSYMETIALPGRISPAMFSRADVLTALHNFENLKEVIIVLGSASDDRHESGVPHGDTWLENPLWTLPDDAQRVLQRIKAEKWPDWKPPRVAIVGSQEDILSKRRIAQISGMGHAMPATRSDSEMIRH